MNFERGKDPKEVMDVGAAKVAIRATEVSYTKENTRYSISYPSGIKAFLKKVQNLDLPNDPVFGIQDIKIKTDFGERFPELAGKIIEYHDEYFAMPTKEKLIEAGFSHLFDNASFEKGVEDAETEMRKAQMKAELAAAEAKIDAMSKMFKMK